MAKYNPTILLIAVIGLLVIVSGCLNSNKSTQKIQPQYEPIGIVATEKTYPQDEHKIINLHAQQIILDDTEIKEVLGSSWKNVDSGGIGVWQDDGIDAAEGVEVIYDEEPFYKIIFYDISGGRGENFAKPVTIKTLVFTDIERTKRFYSKDRAIDSQDSKYYHYKQNEIAIGDAGTIYTIEDLNTIKNNDVNLIIKLIFRKNNIVSIIYFDTEKSNVMTIENAMKLARKQDAKISRILDTIK
ncbi:MAG: hypothetical protein PHU34_06405 [Candidatus Methanoperedens sp.]|nr:hypothetical protein [Candidatus Methanoperedens sp.]